MLRGVRRVFAACVACLGMAVGVEAQAGVIPWVYNAIFGPVGSMRYGAGYAPMYGANYAPAYEAGYASYSAPVSYGYAPAYAYSGYGGCSNGSCCASYGPSDCCGTCGDACGGICGSGCASGNCANGDCQVPAGAGRTTPTPDHGLPATRPGTMPPRSGTDPTRPGAVDPYRRGNEAAPNDGFTPRGRTFSDDPATSSGGGASRPTDGTRRPAPTGGELDENFETPATPRRNQPASGTESGSGSGSGMFELDQGAASGTGTGSTPRGGGNAGMFDVNRVPLDGAEQVIPKKAAPMNVEIHDDETAPANKTESDVKEESAIEPLKLDVKPTGGPVALRERMEIRGRFGAPSIARIAARPTAPWPDTPTTTRLAKHP